MKRKSIIQGFPICVALIFVVLTSGCVGPRVRAYSGDKLQKPEVAVIKGRYYFTPLYYDCVDIYSIDGSILEATKVEILPGWHKLVIEHYVINLFGYPPECVHAEFNFEAGHEYKIKSPFISDLIEIIDVNTGVTIFSHAWVRCGPPR